MQYPAAHTPEEFAARVAAVRARIDAAAARAGRDPGEVRLLPVSKTVPSDRLRAAVATGMTLLGENKVQEAARKSQELVDLGVSWALIGHLQTNKASSTRTAPACQTPGGSAAGDHACRRQRRQLVGVALDVDGGNPVGCRRRRR